MTKTGREIYDNGVPLKHKIPVISILSIVAVLVCLSTLAAPVSAGIATWSAETIPGTVDGVLGPAGVDVRDLAVTLDGGTIYAVTGDSASDQVIYKSTSTGTGWTALDIPIEADLVAVAPDNADTVAIAGSSTPVVYLTVNGGSNWYTLGTPQESGATAAGAIYDLAISEERNGIHYVAAAGKEAGDVANVWYINAGAAAMVWKETNAFPGFSSAGEVAAVAFSPGFSGDQVMVALSEEDSASVKLQIFSFNTNEWNTSADFANYPVTVVSNSGITGLASASIAMAPDYLGDEAGKRNVFIGLTISGSASASAASGIYRLEDDNKTALKTETGIHSLAFDGARLVAGRYDATTVYRSTNPMATTPTVNTAPATKEPGGQNRVVVARAGSKIVAGTSGNESAFAVSTDGGVNFNDVSLVDTAITHARDVAVSTDGSNVYLATDDNTDLSLWSYGAGWQRVLSRRGTADYIVRTAPDNAGVIYVTEKEGSIIYYSKSGGEAEWFIRTGRTSIHDLTVESAEVAYALDTAGGVSRTNNAGFTWGAAIPTGLNSGATIVSVSTNTLLVGSQDGYVAYSTDGGSSWTMIDEVLQSGAGRVQVIADKNFNTNKIIYAASDKAGQDIKKWRIGTSKEWADIFRNTVPGGIYGLAADKDTLYALEFNAGNGQSTLWRCLSPTAATETSENWSSGATGSSTDADDAEVHLNATPQALKFSSGKLWAVKTNGTSKLYSFSDIQIKVTLAGPGQGFVNRVNAINGLADDIPFSWARPSEASEYQLQIAYDNAFNNIITTVTVATRDSTAFALVGPHQTGARRVFFSAGTVYYWRVRTSQPLLSLYSLPRSFTTEPLAALAPDLLTPANGGTDISPKPSFSWEPVSGASEYQFVLSENTSATSPLIDTRVKSAGFAPTEELAYGGTYFWQVRATAPVASGWSALAHFTVKGAPTQPVPPLVVPPAPTPVITLPVPPPTSIVTLPPPPAPAPAIPGHIRMLIIIFSALLLAVIALIVKPFTLRPIRIAGFGDRLGKLGEVPARYLKGLQPARTFKGIKALAAKKPGTDARHPLSFAVESFLWMMTSGKKADGQRLLSGEEEQSLGKVLASRIQKEAKGGLLYQKFPEDAALFLYIWSRYGSRDDTSRYLTRSFQSGPENVISFLKCYLAAPPLPENGLSRTGFSRSRYDSVARVVDPDKVYEALTRLYGARLDGPREEKSGQSPGEAIASQFARIHRAVKSEREKAGP